MSAQRLSVGSEVLILLLGVVAFVAALAPAMRETGTPPGWDQAVHLRDSVVYERILRDPSALGGGVLGEIIRGSEDHPLLTPSGYYPPLVPAVTAVLYTLAGRSYETAMSTQVLFLVLLVFGTWFLGNRLLGSPAGLAAGLMLLAAPGIRSNASEYMLDLPLAAMVVASACALLSSAGFSRLGWSVAFGFLAGAGMLTKWTYFLFLAVPVVLVLVRGLIQAPPDSVPPGIRWRNLGLAILLAAAVAGPYYLPILPILINKTVVHAGGAADGFTSTFTLESLLFHLRALPRRLLGWPLTVTLSAGVLAFLWRGPATRWARVFLLTWAASLYTVFTLAVANKQSRYLLPWLSVLLLVASGGMIAWWRQEGQGRGIVRAVIAGLALLPAVGLRGGWQAEDTGDWNIRPLVVRLEQEIAERNAGAGRVARLGVIPDMRHVNGQTISYYVSREDLPVTVVQLVSRMKRHVSVEVGLDPFDRGDFYQTFDNYDFLATKDGDNAVPPWQAVVPQMHAYFEDRIAAFDLLASYREPDGSTLALYGRRRG